MSSLQQRKLTTGTHTNRQHVYLQIKQSTVVSVQNISIRFLSDSFALSTSLRTAIQSIWKRVFHRLNTFVCVWIDDRVQHIFNEQQYSSIQLYVILFEAQWRKTNERSLEQKTHRHTHTTTPNKYMTMSIQHCIAQQKTHARTNKQHIHTCTHWERDTEGMRKRNRMKNEENNTLHYSKAIFRVVWNCRTRAAASAQSIFVIIATGIVIRYSARSFGCSVFIHFSIFHVSTAPVNILWTTTGKSAREKQNIPNWRKYDKQIEKRLIDGLMAARKKRQYGGAWNAQKKDGERTQEAANTHSNTSVWFQSNSTQFNWICMAHTKRSEINSFRSVLHFGWNQHLSGERFGVHSIANRRISAAAQFQFELENFWRKKKAQQQQQGKITQHISFMANGIITCTLMQLNSRNMASSFVERRAAPHIFKLFERGALCEGTCMKWNWLRNETVYKHTLTHTNR